MPVVNLQHVPIRVAPGRRLAQLFAGLALYGASMALQVEALLGLAPWGVLNDALTKLTGLSFGAVIAIVGVVVMLCWIPLRERPGVGTIANIALISVSVDVTLAVLPTPGSLTARIAFLATGIVLNGLATAAYVGARLGPGPRDGLMTGIAARTGWPIRWVRTGIEVTVLTIGWLLGGTVGIGTALYAVSIGPFTQVFLPWVSWKQD